MLDRTVSSGDLSVMPQATWGMSGKLFGRENYDHYSKEKLMPTVYFKSSNPAVDGSITYSSNLAPQFGGTYTDASASLTINGDNFNGFLTFLVFDSLAQGVGDFIRITAQMLSGSRQIQVDFQLESSGPNTFSGTSIPSDWSLADFNQVSSITVNDPSELGFFTSQLTYFDEIPPTTQENRDDSGFPDFNIINGNSEDNSIIGTPENDHIFGFSGDDILDGRYGKDILDGGSGDDALVAGFDDGTGDTFIGGPGRDIYIIRGSDVEDFVVEIDLLPGFDNYGNTFSGIEDVYGGTQSDLIYGDSSENTLYGWLGNDTLFGGGANDRLHGENGDDYLIGGAGIDTAVYSGDQSSYTLTLSPTSTTFTDRRADGNGTDTLNDMEFLDFDTEIPALGGNPLNLDMFGGPTELGADKFSELIELYIAYFNRAPDALGLNFWATNYSKGQSLQEIATLFLDQDETRALYPEGTSNAVFLEDVYQNVLGRDFDQEGFDFWENDLNSGAIGRDEFIFKFLDGAQGSDVGFLENKVKIGTYFAVTKGMSDGENASVVMDLFDGTDASIDDAVAAIENFYTDALDPTDGEFLMPLVGVLDDPFAMA
ncbi:hypothetical protein C6W92_16910 [Roseovarius sp. A46]|uniref:DUF4214 domain-containing protein n=1 Tax=Roseovarius sp. A46 TaxID=2109331 RepID=UPI00101339ED|nr:DUF4214 domain-containing protein [Roseovarius sp. A46]RXV58477.1 hypothetical protein C6W92_16910 [Roseovarius sp. A46]